ncbi:DEAD/DEAH box helicase [Burkholderia ambifaria]|uniref:DEAD/DEAH box helicase n=1 Tax=Burkholderia ambifaria TaxID=152480 RepID=UPI00158EC9D0|nr:DEAD/DEAH box helicase [Burkholderia ambifaria]MBR8347488.1 DEAD/DEAH box helicase [Burkholderia ambifaria]
MNWNEVAGHLGQRVAQLEARERAGDLVRLNAGQRASLRVFGQCLPENGIVLADEVGMGKTRIAVQVMESVVRCGGRVAVLIPSGLGYQWQRELVGGGLDTEHVLRGILGYMDAWSWEGAVQLNRRQVVVLSHAFSNWQIRENADARRWIMLPALVATLRERMDHVSGTRSVSEVRNWPGGEGALRAAAAIADVLQRKPPPGARSLLEFAQTTQWAPLMRPFKYAAGTECRRMLMKAVGLGLGRFDLVIVDEAHKSRGKDSRLSVLLDEMLHIDAQTRFVAMSATPVELDVAQWLQTLSRIRVPAARLQPITAAVDGYTAALQRVRRSWRTSAEARSAYVVAAGEFQRELGDFVLRRDKREDADVQLYEAHGGRNYRDTSGEIIVDTHALDTPWKQAVCAAEALSVIHRRGDASDKRLRLTLASGHGTSKFLDEDDDDEAAIKNALEAERASGLQPAEASEATPTGHAQQRAAWWRASLQASLRAADEPVYGHPALLAAVAAIEQRTGGGEKVLVFGRYTRPMLALEQLLNAREMLRRLADGRYWPQSRLREGGDGVDQWPAVRAAQKQWAQEHGAPHPVALDQINAELAQRFRAERNSRERFRNALVRRLGEAIASLPIYGKLWAGLQAAAQRSQLGEDDSHPVALLARALLEMTANAAADMDAQDLGREFVALVDAVLDNDPATASDADIEGDPVASWGEFQQRLQAEYGTRTGEFARFMHGHTKIESRRIIQQAFNRAAAAPMVLIAQSLVGREGLNLHEACRIVVLLHPEWNPAVVEQQIGRVDRVGSRWAQEVRTAAAEGRRGNALPRIDVLPVVFRGTYDEHNWLVLRERWDDLRAQLHGEVIPPRHVGTECTEEERALLEELECAAPNFSPTAPWRAV